MRKRVKISLHENFLFFLIFFNIFCSLLSRSAIGFPTQWRHAALVGRQAYRLRLRPGRRPRRSRDACTASDVILYTALKASPNYIKLTYSTDSIFFIDFFSHLLRVSTSILTFNTKDENKNCIGECPCWHKLFFVGCLLPFYLRADDVANLASFILLNQTKDFWKTVDLIISHLTRKCKITLFFSLSVPKNMNEWFFFLFAARFYSIAKLHVIYDLFDWCLQFHKSYFPSNKWKSYWQLNY